MIANNKEAQRERPFVSLTLRPERTHKARMNMSKKQTNETSHSLKDALYRDYNQGRRWQHELHKQAVHKALDIAPDDDVHISQKTTGLGWKELAIIIAGLVATGWFFQRPVAAPPLSSPTTTSPADSEYDIRFYDQDGNLIDVPHVSRRGGE